MDPKMKLGLCAVACAAAFAMLAASQATGQVGPRSKTIDKVSLTARGQAMAVIDEGIFFPPAGIGLEDLPVLGDRRPGGPGRYQMHATETAGEFLVLDTQSGIVTRYSSDLGEVRLYNTRTPSQVVRAPLTERFISTSD